MPQNELLIQVCKAVKREMLTHRESLEYLTIEVFVGSLLADLKARKVITEWEEQYFRKELNL